jgi:hypothetical protein
MRWKVETMMTSPAVTATAVLAPLSCSDGEDQRVVPSGATSRSRSSRFLAASDRQQADQRAVVGLDHPGGARALDGGGALQRSRAEGDRARRLVGPPLREEEVAPSNRREGDARVAGGGPRFVVELRGRRAAQRPILHRAARERIGGRISGRRRHGRVGGRHAREREGRDHGQRGLHRPVHHVLRILDESRRPVATSKVCS